MIAGSKFALLSVTNILHWGKNRRYIFAVFNHILTIIRTAKYYYSNKKNLTHSLLIHPNKKYPL